MCQLIEMGTPSSLGESEATAPLVFDLAFKAGFCQEKW